MRLMENAVDTVHAYHRRFRSGLMDMAPETLRRALSGAAVANGVVLLVHAPLTAAVCLVTGRLGRAAHASYSGLSALAIISGEMPSRSAPQAEVCAWLASQLGTTTALVFAATVTWATGPLGMVLSVVTALNAVLNAYASVVHPSFAKEVEDVKMVASALASALRQLVRRAFSFG